MAALIDHNQYNDLPSLAEADTARQNLSIDKVINGPIRDVFIKHGAHHTFCLYLQHRHHVLNPNQAVVKVGGTAHVIDDQTIKEICSMGNKVIPTTWMTSGCKIAPMEFAIVPSSAVDPAIEAGFLADLLSVLGASGCTSLLGIDTLAQDTWAEMNIGDASVVVFSDSDKDCPQDGFIPVAFAFREDEPKFQVHGKCKKDHKHTTKPTK